MYNIKEITLKIPEDKFDFFMEVFNQLGLEVSDDDFVIPEWQKEVVLERVKKNKKEDLIPWEEARKQFKFKS
ncbi:hypothetical protein ERX46_07130 [Brumimicrobium glaciale]|uniref:Uncharacterized protein n=2 Tax=Brumimicrobium glaciale TaxID=200475 RepID=A0A4Q4KNV3_9FLAO|nr:hypothetical protein ERX46_07130 [Brumimicrobium glaciale]